MCTVPSAGLRGVRQESRGEGGRRASSGGAVEKEEEEEEES